MVFLRALCTRLVNCRMNPGNDEPVRRSTGAPPIPDIPETPEKVTCQLPPLKLL